MGLTKQSTGVEIFNDAFNITIDSSSDFVVALAGNPNTGKSTIFNALTGLNQHTGNWPGKTVTNTYGKYKYDNDTFVLVDLPGTYSLLANSGEEQIARDFICFGNPHATVVVTDATCLERNLNLVLQIMEITNKVIVCVNLIDEASRKKIGVDLDRLSKILGVPVIGTCARTKYGLDNLKATISQVAYGRTNPQPLQVSYNKEIESAVKELTMSIQQKTEPQINAKWIALRLLDEDTSLLQSIYTYWGIDILSNSHFQDKIKSLSAEFKSLNEDKSLSDCIVTTIVKTAEKISRQVVHGKNSELTPLDWRIDNVLTSRIFGIPIMICLLGLVFWITIAGANIPSDLLADGLFYLENKLSIYCHWINMPNWLHDILILGIYRTLAWVVSVMLPPMAIFFPLFTLLEDLGYLPRVAFNLDHYFKKASAHGKQALTMCMGFGCNAAGVISCRIIDSPREKLIAIITNNFVPCNGRFPTLIALATIFIATTAGIVGSLTAALSVLAAIILGVLITLLVSKILSHTILKGLPSSFILELPPYRKPQIGRIIVRSILDRTLFVLGRAVLIAAPAGLIIWLMANSYIGDVSILAASAQYLDPFARLIGLDGYILTAFILGFPANEIVIPILIMSYMAEGSMLELETLAEMKQLFIDNGWTWLTAVCTMLFTLNHWPCGTTLLTIYKETQSLKWTLTSFLVPTIIGIIVCFITAQTVRFVF